MNSGISRGGSPDTGSPPVEHRETDKGGEFTIGRDAIMTYRKSGEGTIVVDHTEVAKQSEGKGLARHLYHSMVEFARERNLKVRPACSYVVAMFKRFPEDRDVLG
jgi:predicted GNAT family acetyltransferase